MSGIRRLLPDWRYRIQLLPRKFTALELQQAMYNAPGSSARALKVAKANGIRIEMIGPNGGPKKRLFRIVR